MLKVCNIRVLLLDYEMWRALSKGAAVTSWPRGTGLSGKVPVQPLTFKVVTFTKIKTASRVGVAP